MGRNDVQRLNHGCANTEQWDSGGASKRDWDRVPASKEEDQEDAMLLEAKQKVILIVCWLI